MSIIQVQDLSKVYRIVEKDRGIAGSFKALFRPRYKDILFASYYPATRILNIDPGLLAWLPPVVAVALAVISYRVWLFGLRHYGGTGS